VHDDQQGGCGDEDELQGPQPNVRDGEVMVITDVSAPGLLRVTVKVFLVISPHLLRCHHVHQHPEDEDYGQPDPSESCRISVHATEDALQCFPVHDVSSP
uniref:Uncharacterized protein n=1 Tax=Callorhinchus milii TaxID=7868 RepID=A0A4W3HJC8_CALMI